MAATHGACWHMFAWVYGVGFTWDIDTYTRVHQDVMDIELSEYRLVCTGATGLDGHKIVEILIHIFSCNQLGGHKSHLVETN